MEHEKNCTCGPECDCVDVNNHDCDCQDMDCDCGNMANMEEIKEQVEDFVEEIKEKTEDVLEKTIDYAKEAKEKYDKADPETKAKIKKGALGGLTVLAGIIGLKKIFGKRK